MRADGRRPPEQKPAHCKHTATMLNVLNIPYVINFQSVMQPLSGAERRPAG